MSGHQFVPNPSNLFADDDVDDQLFLENARRHDNSISPSAEQQRYKNDQFEKKKMSQNYGPGEDENFCAIALNADGDKLGTNFAEPNVLGPEQFQRMERYSYVEQMSTGYVPESYGTMAPLSISPYNSSKHYRQGPSSVNYSDLDTEVDNEIIRQRQIFEKRRKELEDSTLHTSQRCLGVLRETEQVGIATAEELNRQREQLEKTKKQLDEINNSLRYSQKHLNSLKSVFGGLKNYLSGRIGLEQQQNRNSVLSRTNTSASSIEEIYPNPQDFRIPDNYWPDASTHRSNYHQSQDATHTIGTSISGGFSQQLDQNLDDMRGNLSRLKNLALDLNQEIDSQNDLIDDISNRVDDVDVKIGKQNKEMNRLLRK